jgi:GntR family transcriptional regulator / MocR family aminotransferase
MSRLAQQHPTQLPLTLRRRTAIPLQQQIVEQIRQLVLCEVLTPGARIPSTRALAEQLDVSRNTVAIAYELLSAEGLIEVHAAQGTSVSRRLPKAFAPAAPGCTAASARTSERPRPALLARVPALALRAPDGDLLFDFRLGQLDDELFPERPFRQLLARRLEAPLESLARYGDPAGLEALRLAIADHLRRARGIRCSPDRVVVVAGCQEGLNLIARVLLSPGMGVVVENPCYQGAAAVFESHGARLIATPVDEEGLCVSALRDLRAPLAYVTPSHQFPLGFTLSLARRLELLDWASRTGAYVIEDDYDSDFRYEGSPLLALQALDSQGSVIYLGTFSKSIGAGLRLGYAVFPESLAAAAVAAKSIMNNGHPTLDQSVVAEFLASGAFDQHLRRLRHQYLTRRDCLLRQIERHFGPCRVDGIEGGMHVAWRLPEGAPTAQVVRQLALQQRVGLYPLQAAPVHAEGSVPASDSTIFLGYPCLGPERIERALALVAEAVKGSERRV